jgi:hypothetical protein
MVSRAPTVLGVSSVASDITDEMIEAAARALAHTPWDLAPEGLRSVIRDQATRALEAGLAGRTVVELPEPEGRDDWPMPMDCGVKVTYDDGHPVVVLVDEGQPTNWSPWGARELAVRLLAAADRVDHLAAGVGSLTHSGGEQP